MTVPTCRTSRPTTWGLFLFWLLLAMCSQTSCVRANDDYYAVDDDNNYNYNYNNNNGNYNNYNANNNYNNNGDDTYYSANATNGDDNNNNSNGNSNYGQYADDYSTENPYAKDDDLFHWNTNVGFDGVSVMPVSCINYNNGHMIKFQFFESDTSYQCHFSEIGTFVVSIAHYMRAYFNYQALVFGQDFELPSDVGYLNCIKVQETASYNEPLYAKIGCMERETFTSTKLALHFYTDNKCSTPYDDGYPSRRHSNQGYEVKGNLISSQVSFRPPFYTCQTCEPEAIADTFNKRAGTFYDDDYISEHGGARDQEDYDDDANANNANENANGDDGGNGNANNNNGDDYYTDDGYLSANDDVYRNRRLDEFTLELSESAAASSQSSSLVRSQQTEARKPTPAEGELEAFEKEFWESVESQKRALYENNYDAGDWNMCERVYRYGLWCDEECRSLDAFRTDQWSGADMILLSIMCTFLSSMMLLIVAKRLKAAQKRRAYTYDDIPMPGLPPVAMLALFTAIMTIIIVMAKLKFINETLVFAVVTCILLFIYMLKLTLFDKRRPVLLATARHDLFDNPMNERLFD